MDAPEGELHVRRGLAPAEDGGEDGAGLVDAAAAGEELGALAAEAPAGLGVGGGVLGGGQAGDAAIDVAELDGADAG